MTNREKLSEMSNKEIVDTLDLDCIFSWSDRELRCDNYHSCKECIIAWLEAEADE